jgi:predicted nucleic acid-binding protein
MIVVDTNLIGYLLLPSEHTLQVEQVLRRDPEWAAPLLWRSELRNVLAVQMRAGRFGLQHAQAVMTQAETLLHRREYTVASPRVLQLAASSGCSAYDCEFVALAQDLEVRLITVDKQVLAGFPQVSQTPERFLA